MALPIEASTVVVRRERIAPLIAAGSLTAPNATALQDEHLWRCSFMVDEEAAAFLRVLAALGLNVSEGPDSDAVLATEHDQQVQPYCEWLTLGTWDRAVIAWKAGTTPDSVVSREGWNPEVGSQIKRLSPEEFQQYRYEGTKEGVETYVHLETGEKIYRGRTSPAPEIRFTEASRVVIAHMRPGDLSAPGRASPALTEAEETLADLVAALPTWWEAWWFRGRALQTLGRLEPAQAAFRQAVEHSAGDIRCLRELGGVCLALGCGTEAVDVATRAVILAPDDAEALGNLAISFLIAGQLPQAEKAIRRALGIAPGDAVNRNVEQLIRTVVTGVRPQPRNLAEAMQPPRALPRDLLEGMRPHRPYRPQAPNRPWWKFW